MRPALQLGDWGIILLYGVVLIALAVWSKLRRRQNADEYLVARHSMNWFIVALAVFATLFSTISFVAVPGEAYNYGMLLLVGTAGQIIFLPLAIWLFLRFFFNAPTFTAYEYLERRFDRKCRVLASLIFIAIRLFYTGCVFYAAAVIFETIIGWPPLWTIGVVGGVTLLYAFLGGIRAVILADVIQSGIIVCGISAILLRLLQVTGFDVSQVMEFAHQHNHTFELFAEPDFYRLNVHDRWNFWLIALGLLMGPLTTLSCDQLVIQRLLAGKNYRQAVRSVYVNYLIGLPVVTMLFLIGIFLFYYYNAGAGTLPGGVSGDQVLGYFITSELPSPLPGVIITALLSALMSTVAGAVNGIVTVVFKDVVVLLKPELVGSPQEITWCRGLTVLGGVCAIGLALLMTIFGQQVRTTVLEVIGVWASLWPILLVAFFYGVISRRASARAIFIAMLVGCVMNLLFPYLMYYWVAPENRWGYSWVMLPGFLTTLALAPLLSRIWPNRKDLTDLTVFTTSKTAGDETWL